MTKLTDIQAVILTAAAQHDDGSVLPLPETLSFKGGAVDKVLGSLKAKGLIDHQGTPRGDDPPPLRITRAASRPSASRSRIRAATLPSLRPTRARRGPMPEPRSPAWSWGLPRQIPLGRLERGFRGVERGGDPSAGTQAASETQQAPAQRRTA
jgi:hypothetical protein